MKPWTSSLVASTVDIDIERVKTEVNEVIHVHHVTREERTRHSHRGDDDDDNRKRGKPLQSSSSSSSLVRDPRHNPSLTPHIHTRPPPRNRRFKREMRRPANDDDNDDPQSGGESRDKHDVDDDIERQATISIAIRDLNAKHDDVKASDPHETDYDDDDDEEEEEGQDAEDPGASLLENEMPPPPTRSRLDVTREALFALVCWLVAMVVAVLILLLMIQVWSAGFDSVRAAMKGLSSSVGGSGGEMDATTSSSSSAFAMEDVLEIGDEITNGYENCAFARKRTSETNLFFQRMCWEPTPPPPGMSGWTSSSSSAASSFLSSSSSPSWGETFLRGGNFGGLGGTGGGNGFPYAVFEIPARLVGRTFVVDAMYTEGSVIDGRQTSLRHFPALDTEYNMFQFEMTPSRHDSIDVKKPGDLDARIRTASSPSSSHRASVSPPSSSPIDSSSSSSAADSSSSSSSSSSGWGKGMRGGGQSSAEWTGWLASLRVVKRIRRKKERYLVVDASALIRNLFFVVNAPLTLAGVGDEGGTEADVITDIRVTKVSVYPTNTNIDVQVRKGTNLHTSSLYYTFSLTLLSERPQGIVPREAHDSVGYFTTSFVFLDRYNNVENGLSKYVRAKENRYVRIINRRSRFTYYVDPSVPPRFREAVRTGVEAWRVAVSEIRAVLPGESDFPQDYDAGDARYSSISWSVSLDRTFALGPSTVDYRTGEILNSDIVLTHGWIAAWHSDLERIFSSVSSSPSSSSSPRTNAWWRCAKDLDPIMSAAEDATSPWSRTANMTEAEREAFLLAGITDVVMHEVGHTLGLRHNFKGSVKSGMETLYASDASSLPTTDEEEMMTSSVMDYLPIPSPLVELIPSSSSPNTLPQMRAILPKSWFPARIGSYDLQAIRYGYERLDATPEYDNHVLRLSPDLSVELNSHPALRSIAEGAGEFATDEDDPSARGSDPTTNAFDLSSDPLRHYVNSIRYVAMRRAEVEARNGGKGGNNVNRLHWELNEELMRSGLYLCKYLGGVRAQRGIVRATEEEHDEEKKMDGLGEAIPVKVDFESQFAAVRTILSLVVHGTTPEGHDVFPTRDWVAKAGECVGLTQYCSGAGVVSARRTSLAVRRHILEGFLHNSTDRWNRVAGEDLDFLEKVARAATETVFLSRTGVGLNAENVKDEWDLQRVWVGWTRALAQLLQTPSGSVLISGGLVAKIKVEVDRVAGWMRTLFDTSKLPPGFTKPPPAHVLAHYELLAELLLGPGGLRG